MKNSSDKIKQPPMLVCAAKNLYLSLMRCKWMISAQKLTGIGRFSREDNILKSDKEMENDELSIEMQQSKQKDIKEVCRLVKEIETLGLQEIVDKNDKMGCAASQEVLRQMKLLQIFALEYQSFFGDPSNEYKAGGQFKTISELIFDLESKKENEN